MATLINRRYPAFQILNPGTGEWRSFSGGRLEIEPDDPDYAVVMAAAQVDPNISIMLSVSTCEVCGEDFDGNIGKARLVKHMKAVHFDVWLANQDAAQAVARNIEVQSREGFPCDVCRPIQTFGTEEDLSAHVRALHAAAPVLDDAGNEIGGPRPERDEPPPKPDPEPKPRAKPAKAG